MDASILILCKNEAANIDSCLQAVFCQQATADFEVIVIDSGSEDGTLEIIKRYPARLERIPASDFHHARTRNYAASLAQGDILVYLAADALPVDEHWLCNLLRNFGDPCVGAAYGRQLPKQGSGIERQDVLSRIYGEQKVVKEEATRARLGYQYYHMSTVNAAIRKDIWAATKFPEDLKVFEDLGIAKRILESGWKIVYEPAASVYHSHEHTATALFQRYFDIGYTLHQLGIWNEFTRQSMLRDGWNMFWRKVARFDWNGNSFKVGRSVAQELAKSAGFFCGLYERLLPMMLKRKMSAFRVYE
jgi:rhamnosyltransferase